MSLKDSADLEQGQKQYNVEENQTENKLPGSTHTNNDQCPYKSLDSDDW